MTNTIHSVPRELLERVLNAGWGSETVNALDDLRDFLESASSSANHVEDVRAMVAAPSPAGVDGLEVVGVRVTSDGFGSYIADSAMGIPAALQGEIREPLCRLSSASSIIIGLQEKIERLQFSLEVAKTDELSAAVYAETESIKHSLWDAEKERDQQAQRIGELEGLLRDANWSMYASPPCQSGLVERCCCRKCVHGRIDAALSAGKEDAQ